MLIVGLQPERIRGTPCVASAAPRTRRSSRNPRRTRRTDRSGNLGLQPKIGGGAGGAPTNCTPPPTRRGAAASPAQGQGSGNRPRKIRGIGRGTIGPAGHGPLRRPSAAGGSGTQALRVDTNPHRGRQAITQPMAARIARAHVPGTGVPAVVRFQRSPALRRVAGAGSSNIGSGAAFDRDEHPFPPTCRGHRTRG